MKCQLKVIALLEVGLKLKFFSDKLAVTKVQAAVIAIIVIVAVIGVAVYYLTLPSPSPSPTPTPERYLAFRNGTETKVLLLASDLRYGVYEQDIPQLRGCDIEVEKGDPCVIINVTFRNDYTEEWPAGYQISLTADLYNTEREKIGTIMTQGQLFCGFVEVWKVECGETRTFDIYVDYDKQDVDHYDLYIYNIQKYPTP